MSGKRSVVPGVPRLHEHSAGATNNFGTYPEASDFPRAGLRSPRGSDRLCADRGPQLGGQCVVSIDTATPKPGEPTRRCGPSPGRGACVHVGPVLGADADDTLEIVPKHKPEPV
jgi:hypothetical protein